MKMQRLVRVKHEWKCLPVRKLRRNKRLKVRRKFSMLVKDMMETHHMGKH